MFIHKLNDFKTEIDVKVHKSLTKAMKIGINITT